MAHHLKLICDESERGSPKGSGTWVHPGRARRLGQVCDRATAMSAIAAVEHVARPDMTITLTGKP